MEAGRARAIHSVQVHSPTAHPGEDTKEEFRHGSGAHGEVWGWRHEFGNHCHPDNRYEGGSSHVLSFIDNRMKVETRVVIKAEAVTERSNRG